MNIVFLLLDYKKKTNSSSPFDGGGEGGGDITWAYLLLDF
jgi:hypothetical protein